MGFVTYLVIYLAVLLFCWFKSWHKLSVFVLLLGLPKLLLCGCSVGTSVYIMLAALGVLLTVPMLRQQWLTRFIFPIFKRILPRMSDTERLALEAGSVWWDGDLFSGKPDWKKLIHVPPPKLTDDEQKFMDGPVRELCDMLDEWEVEQRGDLPEAVWDHLKKHKFFGLIIPPEFGGLGYSGYAHSAVITRLASRSVTAMVTTMVPNSLGPAELLLKYGTKEQKDHYLPRLATGEEIPCFALTGPEAGSDAASTASVGVVCKGTYEGKEVLGMRLSWKKRYITLAPVATVIGLAFRLSDPDGLLGGEEDRGMTCALIPHDLPGINIGLRHDPVGSVFFNGPTTGKDVFVPLDFIIGGREMAGQGWRMLMECLAVGRAISLPSMSVGLAQLATRVVSAYGLVREQFGLPIGRFEGIEEPLARIGASAYYMNAALRLTLSAIDSGEHPAVISAIMKAYLTEAGRNVVNDAMDIRAGAGISQGPRNILANAYQAIPIAITVEGANILTRTLIIYGQGAIRCHPFVQKEMEAAANNDLAAFDKNFFGHIGFSTTSAVRSFVLGLTGGWLSSSPIGGPAAKYIKQLNRFASAFAITSDMAMGTLGGALKRREKLSGRLADTLSWMYIMSATIKQFVEDGQPERDLPYFRWSCDHALYQIQQALRGLTNNLPMKPARILLRRLIFPFGASLKPPNDKLGGKVARSMLENQDARNYLTRDIYIPTADEPGLAQLEKAYQLVVQSKPILQKLKSAIKARKLPKEPLLSILDEAVKQNIVTGDEAAQIRQTEELRFDVIQVDSFSAEDFRKRT